VTVLLLGPQSFNLSDLGGLSRSTKSPASIAIWVIDEVRNHPPRKGDSTLGSIKCSGVILSRSSRMLRAQYYVFYAVL